MYQKELLSPAGNGLVEIIMAKDAANGTIVRVPPGYVCLVVNRCELQDVFGEGDHKIRTGVSVFQAAWTNWTRGGKTLSDIRLVFVAQRAFSLSAELTLSICEENQLQVGLTAEAQAAYRIVDPEAFVNARVLVGSQDFDRAEHESFFNRLLASSASAALAGELEGRAVDTFYQTDAAQAIMVETLNGRLGEFGLKAFAPTLTVTSVDCEDLKLVRKVSALNHALDGAVDKRIQGPLLVSILGGSIPPYLYPMMGYGGMAQPYPTSYPQSGSVL